MIDLDYLNNKLKLIDSQHKIAVNQSQLSSEAIHQCLGAASIIRSLIDDLKKETKEEGEEGDENGRID